MSIIVVNSVALERGILKEIMQMGNASMDIAASTLGNCSEHFYDELRRNIYTAIVSLYEEDRNINSMIVLEKLKSTGKYNSLYREEFTRINTSKLTGEMTEACLMLLDYSSKRKIGNIFEGIIQKSSMENVSCNDLIDDIVKGIDDITNKNAIAESSSLDEVLSQTIEHIYNVKIAHENGTLLGTFPGFTGLMESIGALTGNQLIVLAGRPAQGKTAFALSMAIEMAKQVPVAFFSLEMDSEQLMMRVISREMKIPLGDLRSGKLTDRQLGILTGRSFCINELNLIIDDKSDLDLMLLRNKIRKYKHDSNIQAVVIDYLQLMTPPNARSREQEVGLMTRTLKKLSKIYNIPIIILAQLNRNIEQRGGNAIPQLSDLRESGSIEQDADIVMFIHDGSIHIAKQRQGATGVVPLHYDKTFTGFWDVGDADNTVS